MYQIKPKNARAWKLCVYYSVADRDIWPLGAVDPRARVDMISCFLSKELDGKIDTTKTSAH